MIFINTERLSLRKIQEDDFEDFCTYAMDDDMCKMMGRSLMLTKEDARVNFNWLKDKEERCYALINKTNEKVIGNLTVADVSKSILSLDSLINKKGKSLSFSISKDYQRKGLMLEAVSSVIKHLFEKEEIDYIQCGHFTFNIASEALQKKLGFTYLTKKEFEEDGEMFTAIENILWK